MLRHFYVFDSVFKFSFVSEYYYRGVFILSCFISITTLLLSGGGALWHCSHSGLVHSVAWLWHIRFQCSEAAFLLWILSSDLANPGWLRAHCSCNTSAMLKEVIWYSQIIPKTEASCSSYPLLCNRLPQTHSREATHISYFKLSAGWKSTHSPAFHCFESHRLASVGCQPELWSHQKLNWEQILFHTLLGCWQGLVPVVVRLEALFCCWLSARPPLDTHITALWPSAGPLIGCSYFQSQQGSRSFSSLQDRSLCDTQPPPLLYSACRILSLVCSHSGGH